MDVIFNQAAVVLDSAPIPLGPPDFRVVYEREFKYVWHTLRRLGAELRDLEDLAHEVFLVFYRTLADFDAARPLRPWLFGISFRVCSDYRRKSSHRCEIPSDDAVFAQSHTNARAIDVQVAHKQELERVALALQAVPLDQRVVFIMHDLDGHSMPEIADVIGAPLNTLYSRLRLGRESFTRAVAKLTCKGAAR